MTLLSKATLKLYLFPMWLQDDDDDDDD